MNGFELPAPGIPCTLVPEKRDSTAAANEGRRGQDQRMAVAGTYFNSSVPLCFWPTAPTPGRTLLRRVLAGGSGFGMITVASSTTG